MTTHLPVINFTDICHLKQPKEDNEMKAVVKSHPTNWFSCAAFDVESKYFIYLSDLDYQQFRNNLTSVNFIRELFKNIKVFNFAKFIAYLTSDSIQEVE